MENQIEEYDDWDMLIRKAVAAKARAALRLPAATRDLDQHCPRGHRPTGQAKNQSNNQSSLQGTTLKNIDGRFPISG